MAIKRSNIGQLNYSYFAEIHKSGDLFSLSRSWILVIVINLRLVFFLNRLKSYSSKCFSSGYFEANYILIWSINFLKPFFTLISINVALHWFTLELITNVFHPCWQFDKYYLVLLKKHLFDPGAIAACSNPINQNKEHFSHEYNVWIIKNIGQHRLLPLLKATNLWGT